MSEGRADRSCIAQPTSMMHRAGYRCSMTALARLLLVLDHAWQPAQHGHGNRCLIVRHYHGAAQMNMHACLACGKLFS